MPDRQSSRVVSLSSVAHRRGRIHFDDLACAKPENARAAYAQSKVACLIFAIELNRRLSGSGSRIVSVAAHPGVSPTPLFKETPAAARMLMRIMQPIFMHSAEQAAKPTLHAALDPTVRGGEYYGPQKMGGMKGPVGHAYRTPYSDDPEVARRLWEVSEELTGASFTRPVPVADAE
jgi:NAD(P)-dependent dehydrogenase (short-subunit alcohol dehydrogenase family)